MGIIYSGDGGGVPRKTAHIFAKNASLDDVTIFGSTLAGDTQKSTDLDDIQSEAYEIGWRDAVISNKNYPLLSDMNGVMLTFSQQIAYLLQHGSCGWDNATTYYTYDLVNVDGIIYVCTIDENIGNPPSELNGWAVFYNPDIMANIDLSNLSEIGEAKLGRLPQFCVNSGSVDADGNGNCLQLPSGSTTIITKNWIQPALSSNGTWGVSDFAVKWIGSGEGAGGAYIAFDGNSSSHTTSGKHYVNTYLCFYSSQTINISNINIYMSWMPRTACEILASNDDSTYISLGTFSNSASSWDIPINTNGQEYKYWRIHFTAGGTSDNWPGYINEVTITATYQEEIVSADNIILKGSEVPIKMTNGYNASYILTQDNSLDMSTGYTDGTYNVYASITDGSLSAYKAPLYIQKSEPLGENVATSTNAITSGDYSGQPKANAFDGNLSTFWGSAQVGSSAIDGVSYIGNSGLTQPVKRVRLFQAYEGSTLPQSQYCDSIKLQYSNDGTNWIDIQTVTGLTYQTWEEIQVDDYTPTGATHSFRLLAITKIGGTSSYNWIIGELQLLTDTEANTVWLDKSVRPLKAYKYNNGWQEFTGVPVGTCTVASNIVTAVKTFAYNVNGIENSLIKNYQNGVSGYTLEWRYNSYNQKIMRYCIQYGAYSTGTGAKTITLLVSYGINVNYFVSFEQHYNTASGEDGYAPILGTNKTGSAFSFVAPYAYGGLWKAEGWIEE